MLSLKSKRWMVSLMSMMPIMMFLLACKESPKTEQPLSENINVLSDAEKADGWILLFDGKSFNGWHGLGREEFPSQHWLIKNGVIEKIASVDGPKMPDGQPMQGGDIITDQAWTDFILIFDWKISTGGNSGVKYNVSEELSTSRSPGHAALGWEYQVLDDEINNDKLEPTHRAASLYDMIEATNKTLKPVGEWNTGKIVFIGNHGEHWLNGVKVVEYDMDTPEFKALFEKSKYAKIPGFMDKKKGHIVLQDHSSAAWYRNIKIKPVSE
jgi:hypothetical protein